jgi:hypothetical protein
LTFADNPITSQLPGISALLRERGDWSLSGFGGDVIRTFPSVLPVEDLWRGITQITVVTKVAIATEGRLVFSHWSLPCSRTHVGRHVKFSLFCRFQPKFECVDKFSIKAPQY